MTASLFSISAFSHSVIQGLVEEKQQHRRTRRCHAFCPGCGLLSPVMSTLYNTSHSHGDCYRSHLELPFSLFGRNTHFRSNLSRGRSWRERANSLRNSGGWDLSPLVVCEEQHPEGWCRRAGVGSHSRWPETQD